MSKRLTIAGLVCVLTLVSAVIAGAQTTTALYLDSQPGDPVGNGLQHTWLESDLTFSPFLARPSRIEIAANNFSTTPSTHWFLTFVGIGGTALLPGVYEYAMGDPPQSSRPGLSVFGSAACSRSAGRFVIYEATFDGSGTLTAFAADFEQHCDDLTPALFGAIRYRSSRANLVPFDGNDPVYALHLTPSPYGRVSGGGLDCGEGAIGCDLQYSAGASVTLTASPSPGYVFLAWNGDCASSPAAVTIVVSRRKRCDAMFEAAPGSGNASVLTDSIRLFVTGTAVGPDGTAPWLMQSSDSDFTLDGGVLSSVAVTLSIISNRGDSWRLTLSPPSGQTLAPGTYERAGHAGFQSPMMPGFEIHGPAIECNKLRARFVIYEIARDSSGRLTRLAADFEQHCDGRVAGVFGAIRYNASPRTMVPFDGAYPFYSLTIEPPLNGRVTASGIDCGLTASDCDQTFGSGGAVTLTAAPAPGHAFVGWTGDCAGNTLTTITVISRHSCAAVFDDAPDATGGLSDDLRGGSLFVFSEPGDGVGRGQRQLWTRRDTQFMPGEPSFDHSTGRAQFQVITPDDVFWLLDFSAPSGEGLHSGDYTNAIAYTNAASGSPGLSVSGNGVSCAAVTGRFRVYDIHFDATGRLDVFAADFEQHCDGHAPALFGAIRYHSTRSAVLPFDGSVLPRPLMALDTPSAGSIVGRPFAIGGWALNPGESAGTGVDAVHVYAFPAGGGAPTFLGSAAYGVGRPDVAAIFGSAFGNSGFTLTAGATLPPDRYLLVAYAHDTVTGTFDLSASATVTIEGAVSSPRIAVDTPSAGAVLAGEFSVAGWAIDTGASTGAGIDAVHIYAFPSAGGAPIFLGVADYGRARPDVGAVFGDAFRASGYALQVSGLASGAYSIVVYAHSTLSGQFSAVARPITVVSAAMAVDTPTDTMHVSGSFLVSGWAFDAAAQSGSGVDGVHVWALPASGDPAVFLGAATTGTSRPDIGALFGSRFSDSGFTLTAPPLLPGAYRLLVYVHSAATGEFNQLRQVWIQVD